MNPIAQALKTVVEFIADQLPEAVRPFLQTVANLLGRLDLSIGDPIMAKVADLIAGLLVDFRAISEIEDADVAMRARLLAENRFTRAWRDLGLEAA